MYGSLMKLAALPPGTLVLSGHEFTQMNADFALTVDADNIALQRRAEETRALRAKGLPTIP